MAGDAKPKRASRAADLRAWRAKQRCGGLLPFQQAFSEAVSRVKRPPDIAALSCPRGNGKSWLCGRLVARSLTPGDSLFDEGVENVLVSASRPQAAIVLEFAREALGEAQGYRWRKDGVEHLDSRTRVRVISSDAKRALGLGANIRIIIADEPGAWAPTAGLRLWNAITTALGKRKMTVVAVGTLAPAPLKGPGSWWPSFIASGTGDGRLVSLLQADPDSWRDFQEVLRVNPVAAINPYLRRTLEREHKAAIQSERAARTFRQFRLNLPGDPVDSQPLVTGAEWERVTARPVPARAGRPTIGVDLGGTRSWSAAAAVWPSGRIECWAIAPGVPTLAEQEREDQVAEGSYSELVRSGGLAVDAGRAVPSIERLLSPIWPWEPAAVVADPYRSAELQGVVAGRVRIIERARGGGEATSNVQSLRALLLDSPAGVAEDSRELLGSAFEQTALTVDSAGLTKVSKARAKRSREDAAAALLLAAGEMARRPVSVPLRVAFIARDRSVTWH